jgi:copper chaperone
MRETRRVEASKETTSMEFIVKGMTCGHCVKAVESAVRELDPAATISVELDSGRVAVESAAATAEAISAAIVEEGYEVVPA